MHAISAAGVESGTLGAVSSDADEADLEPLGEARPSVDVVDRAVVKARAAASLFGAATERPRVGRYHLLERVGAGGMGVVYSAYDPELDRAVAIKLVRARSARARARLLAEGKSLAQLSHPNVVPVFDVGLHGDDVYLVMELVRGQSLRGYARAHAGRRRDVLRAYREAGEGLAAAHRAGVIHRDFKPDNAVVGADGRVRVLDFGLAQRSDEEGDGGIAGTPRYMPPEQQAGGAITAAVDQYAFCVSLREAVGDTPGDPPPPLPRWIERIVERGTRADPAERFESMDALLAALGRDPAVRRRNGALVAGVVAAGAAAFALGRAGSGSSARAPQPACETLAALDAWGVAPRQALATRLGGADDPYLAAAGPAITLRLDDYAAAWGRAQVTSCRAIRAGAQSPALHDRRVACLARARAAFATAVEVLATAAPATLPDAVVALDALPDVEACVDPRNLFDRIAPPPAAIAAQVTTVEAALARAEVLARAAHPAAEAEAIAVLGDARAVGYAPLVARALVLEGRIRMEQHPRDAALAPLTEAVELAISVGDDPLAIESLARQLWVVGTGADADPASALASRSLIEALAGRLGEDGAFARALLHNNVGGIELARGDRAAARAALERALVEARHLRGVHAIELASIPANLALLVEEPERRAALFAESIQRLTAALGADHPRTLDQHVKQAMVTSDPEAARRLLEPTCAAYGRLHPRRGEDILDCWFEVGLLAHDRGDEAAAATAMEQAVSAVRTAALEPVPDRFEIARGYLALARGDAAAARELFAARLRSPATPEDGPWWRRLLVGEAELGLGEADRALGRDATTPLTRAVSTFARIAEQQPLPPIERRLARARAELRAQAEDSRTRRSR